MAVLKILRKRIDDAISTNRFASGMFVVLCVLFLAGFALRFRDFNLDIAAYRSAREAHVASNIFYFARDGISLSPEIFARNQTNKLFEFPLFSWVAAVAVNILHTPIAQTARGINLIFWMIRFWLAAAIIYKTTRGWGVTCLALLIIILSPLDAFYSRALIADNLALLFAMFSVMGFLLWSRSNQPGAWLMMTLSGVAATFIKSPTYLPFAAGIGMAWLYGLFPFAFSRRKVLPFVGYCSSILLSLIVFRLVSNSVNTGNPLSGANWENQWYFGSLADRFRPTLYNAIIRIQTTAAASQVAWGLAGIGMLLTILRRNTGKYLLWVAMVFGSIISILIFLPLHAIHDYYSLPYLLPMAFFAALALNSLIKWLPNFLLKLAPIAGIFLILFVFFVKWDIPRAPLDLMVDRGKLIKAYTPSDAFVFYTSTSDWSPDRLYFAQREGFNLSEKVAEWQEGGVSVDGGGNPIFKTVVESSGHPYSKIYIFVTPAAMKNDRSFYDKQPWELIASNNLGYLFLAQP